MLMSAASYNRLRHCQLEERGTVESGVGGLGLTGPHLRDPSETGALTLSIGVEPYEKTPSGRAVLFGRALGLLTQESLLPLGCPSIPGAGLPDFQRLTVLSLP